jgi:hypothetical protein
MKGNRGRLSRNGSTEAKFWRSQIAREANSELVFFVTQDMD